MWRMIVMLWIAPLRSLSYCLTTHARREVVNNNNNNKWRCFSNLDDLMNGVDGMIDDLDSSDSTSDNNGKHGWKYLENLDNFTIRETKPSPVEEKTIQGRRVFIKRDDLLRLPGSQISGNKARKLLAINEIPVEDFPNCLVSYGGPQSNSMLALSALVNYKDREAAMEVGTTSTQESGDDPEQKMRFKRFVYYTKKLPRFLRNQPSGNLFRAMTLGMELIELSNQDYEALFGGDWGGSSIPPMDPPVFGESLWVPQGGAFGQAQIGARVLAKEIVSFWLDKGEGRPLSVCLPGGTCTTAVLLHHELKKLISASVDPLDIEVVVIPCVGDASYARRQMSSLCVEIGAKAKDIPSILMPAPDTQLDQKINKKKKPRYFSFGQPDKSIMDVFKMMRDDYETTVDLLYGAPAWTILLRHWNSSLSQDLRYVNKQVGAHFINWSTLVLRS